MHILFIGYGKTSQRLAKQLSVQGHQISTISLTPKTDPYGKHHVQDVHQLNLTDFTPIDCVYVLLSPRESIVGAYQHTYLDTTTPIVAALQSHPIQRLIVVSSTRVYGENQGQEVNDETDVQPSDVQGQILYDMEQAYLKAYPQQTVIVRPSGIYGTSVARMQKMAKTMQHYPNVHWSNRIHINDVVRFLAHLLHVEHVEKSYILSNNQPQLLHEVVQWFQRQMYLPLLTLDSEKVTGKKLYATRLAQTGFQLQHQDCFADYAALMKI